jgi:phosphatidylserine decarboxylase
MNQVAGRAFVLLQRVLPKYLMTAAIHSLARIRYLPVKNWLIARFVAAYDVDVDEVRRPVPDGFDTFNDFFTRELTPEARPVDGTKDSLISPVDGTVSAAGPIRGDTLIQAKGISYTLPDLLATDLALSAEFADGSFATIYLAPHNYHRVHCPMDAELVSARYVPGHLYSVNAQTVTGLPGLFTGNERLICQFQSANGPMILIFVGALHVGSISTPWTGEIRPQKNGVVQQQELPPGGHSKIVARGDLLGWFNMGSTVILLLPPGRCRWLDHMTPGSPLRMGQRIAALTGSRP